MSERENAQVVQGNGQTCNLDRAGTGTVSFPDMLSLLQAIANRTGLQRAVRNVLPDSETSRLLLCAYCLLDCGGSGLRYLQEWQDQQSTLTERLSMEDCVSLLESIGGDSEGQRMVFESMADALRPDDGGELRSRALVIPFHDASASPRRQGQKILLLSSAERGLPFSFCSMMKLDSETRSVLTASEHWSVRLAPPSEYLTTSGLYEQEILRDMLSKEIPLLAPVDPKLPWVSEQANPLIPALSGPGTRCRQDPYLHWVSAEVDSPFPDSPYPRLWLTLFQDVREQNIQRSEFETALQGVMDTLMSGVPSSRLRKQARRIADQFFFLEGRGRNLKVIYNRDACDEVVSRMGVFAFLSCRKNPPEEILWSFRQLRAASTFFDLGRSRDASPAIQSENARKGRRFVQFLAICLHESCRSLIRSVQCSLESPLPDADPKTVIRLSSWLRDTSMLQMLRHFVGQEPLNADEAARDRLCLDLLSSADPR